MTEQEKIALLERLTASGAQIGQLNLGDGHQYFGCSITQTSSAPSSTSKVVQVVDVLASSCDTQESSANPYPFVSNPNKAEEIIGLLKQYMRGIDLSKPKDLMMPVRAAIVAGVIRKPSYTEFKDALPDFTPKHSSSLDHYLRYEILPNGKENDQYNPYKTIPAYKKMVEAFEAFKV